MERDNEEKGRSKKWWMRERQREGGRTFIVTPPVCDGRISGAGGILSSPLCGLQPPGYGEEVWISLHTSCTAQSRPASIYRSQDNPNAHAVCLRDPETRDPGDVSYHTWCHFQHVKLTLLTGYFKSKLFAVLLLLSALPELLDYSYCWCFFPVQEVLCFCTWVDSENTKSSTLTSDILSLHPREVKFQHQKHFGWG